ncbi:hypothetical protein H0194_08060 [Corynebacterium incognita]|uniref:Primosomal protein n=1 Tax=Corynebacterium incognita TaxID=2754725 RepID=A0A7G7CN64_9CORY|nr:hypothetical protein [Corynebacterium incognita]QNE89030.1 hypothetical protein H0194_08060 [Corynebacterium incognita]
MNSRAIVPVKLSLLSGDFYTLWAPKWRERGAEWQAFLGDDDSVLLFESPAQLLTFIAKEPRHDLVDHPNWEEFQAGDADRVVPVKRNEYDLAAVPEALAGRPGHENVSTVARNFEVLESLGVVTGAEPAKKFFGSHSMLKNVERGAEHYSGDAGLNEWSGVGYVVVDRWKDILESLEDNTRVVDADELDTADIKSNEEAIATAVAAAKERREALEAETKKAKDNADPYDETIWAQAGIDPVKITVDNKSVYTLRTYLDGAPVFLGKWGEIFTFPSTKQLARWIVDNDDHDMAKLSTWEDLSTAANSGELVVTVHPVNQYTFSGIARDIAAGPEHVDNEQMGRAYEVCADAADWAGDDSVNSFMIANPRFQDYLGYMLGSTEHAGYVPSKPYDDHVKAWQGLEEMLIKRFSKF